MPSKKVRRIYAEIRKRHPDKPGGPHWESVGCYVGDNVWLDPESIGMPGEIEFMPTHHLDRLYDDNGLLKTGGV